jgi:hypothetical protein
MSSEQDVLKALRALAEADRAVDAPPVVEQRLRFAFRRRRIARRWNWAMVAAAAIAGVMIGAAYFRRAEPVVVKPEPVRAKVEQARPVEPAIVPVPPPVRNVARVRRPQPREIATPFFPLVDIAPPMNNGAVVRVSLPASAMRTVGLPVREDRLSERVQADVLMSETGMATAIRFVTYSQE